MRKTVRLLLFFLGCGLLLFWAWRQGEARHYHDLTLLEKEIPLPILFDSMEGSAVPAAGDMIRVDWTKKMLPAHPSRSYLLCVGTIHPKNLTYYVLELDGNLYIENNDFVEPLLFALYNLDRGKTSQPLPGSIEDVITLLPDERERLVALAGRLKKVRMDK